MSKRPDNLNPLALVLFDGECGLCARGVQFLIKRDPLGQLEFAPLQSELGQRLLRERGLDENLDSMVLLESDRTSTHSTASLRSLKYLRAPWPLLRAFLAVPRPLRDACYRFVARHRKKFGSPNCEVLSANQRARFRS